MSIAENIAAIKAKLPGNVRLVAVSKTKPVELLQEAYDSGQRIFGENKALEMRDKHTVLPTDIEWHFIGHLQSNKIKYIAPFVSLIHSVDSLELLKAIDKEAAKNNRVIPCLLQVYIANEDTKYGLDDAELFALLDTLQTQPLANIALYGLMGMATFTDDKAQVQKEFGHLAALFNKVKAGCNLPEFTELSMGMSGDYKEAISEGSTLIRIGSDIFGHR
ncbi:MAG: YggS family pyridoxal phosphate-dependent enzyme [Sphingobacteriales bacterium JAD_PAG50586_3]|nr:MAG: YggS family pyridoxal phosphate-dependent enzyme [Sphingobacteriales bacterium JAD_PAG50586_3]